MNIDDLVDERTNQATPGERFHENWLAKLPAGQWPAYIDENARLIDNGIFIGETDLTSADFGSETGAYYQQGLAEAAGIEIEQTSLPVGQHTAEDIGVVAWVFNLLREEIRRSSRTNFRNPSRAIEAAINKALVESIEDGSIGPSDLETIRLPDTATVSTLMSEVFCRPRSEAYIDLLLQTVKQSKTDSLLEHLDEPRMVTPLWEHQREALDRWLAHDCRGYVDMATATGKTVLGLAAIAHHFGALHPHDRDIHEERLAPATNDRATVLVVAHRGLILDQWKREFDCHLNIPEQSTTQSGEQSAEFEWGNVHFWTPSRVQNRDIPDADLVILDETHHYLGSSGFGGILDELDGHLLALSGSLDDANARTLRRRNISKVFEFTLRDGQRAGVIPQCDWDVVFTPYENQSNLAEVTAKYREGVNRYEGEISVPDELSTDGPLSFANLSEARSIAQSSVGRQLKEQDASFREFASAVMGRQLTQYNLSPALSAVVRLVIDRIDQHKCVVLLETDEEIQWVASELEAHLGDEYESLVTLLGTDADLSVVESFDREQEHGAIIGVARTLGEGVDIQTADVCINRGRGRLSRSLVQRMGRILRNPDGQKHAEFFHISGLPMESDALLADEDGVRLLETASQLLAWGEKFDARPVFTVDTGTAMTERTLTELEIAGAMAIEEWAPDHYTWPSDAGVRDHLQSLCSEIPERDDSALLAIERLSSESPTGTPRKAGKSPKRTSEGPVPFVAAEEGGVEIPTWLYDLASAATQEEVITYIEACVRRYAQDTLAFPEEPILARSENVREVALNPALNATLTAYAASAPKSSSVAVAIARGLPDEIDRLLSQSCVETDHAQIRQRLRVLSETSEAGST